MQCNIVQCTMSKRSCIMIASIKRFLDALFAPLAYELGRMPASAVRGLFGTF